MYLAVSCRFYVNILQYSAKFVILKMAKIKKSVIAAKKASKKAKRQDNVANNPFEVRVNKKKYEILGRKMKHERGLPGVSRSKALQKVI